MQCRAYDSLILKLKWLIRPPGVNLTVCSCPPQILPASENTYQNNETPHFGAVLSADNLRFHFNVIALWVLQSSTDIREAQTGVHGAV